MYQRMFSAALVLGLLGQVVSEEAILASISQQCKSQAISCLYSDTTGTNLILSSKYCEAIKYLTSLTCLVVCTQSEYDRVKNAACGGMSTGEPVVSTVSQSNRVLSTVSGTSPSTGHPGTVDASTVSQSTRVQNTVDVSTVSQSRRVKGSVDVSTVGQLGRGENSAYGASSQIVRFFSLILSSLVFLFTKVQ
ncbi:hypothetical protein Bpfe_007786 [Biomphalaria pfeifferi]|uniref:Uncharacterized protein n=1 Tax=Biomphalaria pfeifferi TaxID=112525 RepID=A0AAD8BXP8_BIOPF|nr:hypothetical protein Bpfe_007786 [Biomphalaria pfeifferi]